MLFLVNLANQGLPEGAYFLSKLYSRGIYRGGGADGQMQPLVSRNSIKAAVWTQVALNVTGKQRKADKQKELTYYEQKL